MGKKKQEKIERLIRDLRKAKKEILRTVIATKAKHRSEIEKTKKDSSDFDGVAAVIAKRRYGELIDKAIKSLEKKERLDEDAESGLRVMFESKADESGAGPWRMKKYHSRFLNKVEPIYQKALKL